MSNNQKLFQYKDPLIFIADTISASFEITRNAFHNLGVYSLTIAKPPSDPRK